VRDEVVKNTSYPELPFISPPPPPNRLSYQNAISILKSITSINTAKAVFAIMVAEASKYQENGKNVGFNSAGGYNYSGVQTDAGRWGAPGIIARYRRNDSERSREFAVFESDTAFLKFMANRIEKKKLMEIMEIIGL
jgi:hypothetical protein